MPDNRLKCLEWIGSARQDLLRFPEEVRRTMGFALYQAQAGGKHVSARPLRGFGGAGVLEVVESLEGNAYRTVYTVQLGETVYVLHAFQKKSTSGARTPDREMRVVHERLRQARLLDQRRL